MFTHLIILSMCLLSSNGYSDIGYPGRNKVKLEAIKTLWEDYYNCLQNDYKQFGATKQRKIVQRYIFPGQRVDLVCDSCQRPFETTPNTTWKYQAMQNLTTGPILLDFPPEFTTNHLNTLQIRNARAEFSGLYQCFRGNSSLAAYLVEIPEEVNMTQVGQPELTERNETFSKVPALSTSIVWQNWTICSACDKIGKQFRYGICMLNYSSAENETSDLGRFFDKFKGGISCTSEILPNILQNFTISSNLTHLVVNKFCKEVCPPKEDKIEIDPKKIKLDQLTDTLNNLKSKLPEEESRILDADFGARIILQCPGALMKDIPVTWKVKNKEIIKEILENDTNGRITIDFFQRLIINNAVPSDSARFSCWQQQNHVGNIHVYINQKEVKLEQTSMTVTTIFIVLLIIAVAIRAMLRRRRTYKQKKKITEHLTKPIEEVEELLLNENFDRESYYREENETEFSEDGREIVEESEEEEIEQGRRYVYKKR